MKNEKWIVYLIVGFTSITTVLLLMDGSFIGFIRAIVSAVILDGLIAYWDEKRVTLKDNKQREYSRNMMWAGIAIMLLFAIGYGIELFAPDNALKPFDLFGYKFTMTLTEFIVMLATAMIGAWVVATLAIVMYLKQIDPDILNDLENTKAIEEAESARRKVEHEAYKTAMNVTSRSVGTEKALRMFRKNLEDMACYKPFEIDEMVERAYREIEASRNGATPAAQPVHMRAYAADGETVRLDPKAQAGNDQTPR